MVYSDFVWSPPDMVSVLILDSRKYGHHQFYLYNENQKTIEFMSFFSLSSVDSNIKLGS